MSVYTQIGVISTHDRLLERCPGKSAGLISFDDADTLSGKSEGGRRSVFSNPLVINNGLAQESMM